MDKVRSQQEKQRGNQNKIRKLIVNEKEINNETEILNQIKLRSCSKNLRKSIALMILTIF